MAVAAWSASPHRRSWRSGSWMADRRVVLAKLAAITPRNSPAANSGATTEAGMPEASIRVAQLRVLDGRRRRGRCTSWPLIIRWISGIVDLDRQGSSGVAARIPSPPGGPPGSAVAEAAPDQRGTIGPRSASGGVMPAVYAPSTSREPVAVPQVDGRLVAAGHLGDGVGQDLEGLGQVGETRQLLAEGQQRPRRRVAATGVAQDRAARRGRWPRSGRKRAAPGRRSRGRPRPEPGRRPAGRSGAAARRCRPPAVVPDLVVRAAAPQLRRPAPATSSWVEAPVSGVEGHSRCRPGA